jgi:hypothetical protein
MLKLLPREACPRVDRLLPREDQFKTLMKPLKELSPNTLKVEPNLPAPLKEQQLPYCA